MAILFYSKGKTYIAKDLGELILLNQNKIVIKVEYGILMVPNLILRAKYKHQTCKEMNQK